MSLSADDRIRIASWNPVGELAAGGVVESGGSDPNPTFDSLHVTGASTLDGTTFMPGVPDETGFATAELTHEAIISPFDGSRFRVHVTQDTFGDGILFTAENVSPEGTASPASCDLIMVSAYDFDTAVVWQHFKDGHFGDVTQILPSYSGIGSSLAGDVANLTIFTNGPSQRALIYLDGTSGNIGIGSAFYAANPPAAFVHIAGDGLYDGDLKVVGKVGFNGAEPSQPTLATGAAHTVDDVITVLQTLGLVKQS